MDREGADSVDRGGADSAKGGDGNGIGHGRDGPAIDDGQDAAPRQSGAGNDRHGTVYESNGFWQGFFIRRRTTTLNELHAAGVFLFILFSLIPRPCGQVHDATSEKS